MNKTWKKPVHKWKKGEKPEAVAKRYGHRSFDVIWKDAINKPIAKKRGKPESLQPGDVLTIPFNQKEIQVISEFATTLQASIEGERQVQKIFDRKGQRFEDSARRIESSIKKSDEIQKAVISRLQVAIKDAKAWGDGVDFAASIAMVAKDCAKFIHAGYKAMGKVGEDLAKANKEMAKDAVKVPYNLLRDEAGKAIGKHVDKEKKKYGLFTHLAGAGLNAWFTVTSPSYWAYAFAKFTSGKSFGDSFFNTFQTDVQKQIAEIRERHKKSTASWHKMLKLKKEILYDLSMQRNASCARMIAAEKELKEIEKLI